MNRRHLVLATLASGSIPLLAAAQTPLASPAHEESMAVDRHALDLLRLLQAISPLELVRELQVTAVTTRALEDSHVVPWVDFGDTDLYSSLGGAVIMAGNAEVHDRDPAMLGGYIVYESAEIAYQEFVRKLGPAYDIPSTTISVAGTTVWELGNDTMRTAVARIGYVMLLANTFDAGTKSVIDAVIDHLVYVAARVDA